MQKKIDAAIYINRAAIEVKEPDKYEITANFITTENILLH